MFRRKEESLFDTDLLEENESFAVVQPAAVASPVSAPVVAASTASTQPISRPLPVPPSPVVATAASATAHSYRPASAPVPPVQPSANRLPESKIMTPISSSQASSQKSSNRVLTVGTDILLKGEITTCDRLVIEGKVEATISDVNTVELAECGSFKGSANVVDAQISGLFEGDLVVTGRLVIYASGKVRGNISYGEIEIERGGELSGTIKSAGVASVPKALSKAA